MPQEMGAAAIRTVGTVMGATPNRCRGRIEKLYRLTDIVSRRRESVQDLEGGVARTSQALREREGTMRVGKHLHSPGSSEPRPTQHFDEAAHVEASFARVAPSITGVVEE